MITKPQNLSDFADALLARWEAQGKIKPLKKRKALKKVKEREHNAVLLAEAARDMRADMYGENGNG